MSAFWARGQRTCSMFSYPGAVVERAMKIQEVMLRAVSKQIT
jgi:hypothetical protein